MEVPVYPAAGADPATWHVVFWSLVCLGISCMSQPRKQFCHVTSRYRIYLVASPMLCAADTISAILRLVLALSYCRSSLYHASWFAARGSEGSLERGNESELDAAPEASELEELPKSEDSDEDEELYESKGFPDDEGLPTNEELHESNEFPESESTPETHRVKAKTRTEVNNWPRILLFILGTLPAFIKLAALGGIPWTKAWGMMFMANFVGTEVISLLSYMSSPPHGETAENLQQALDPLDRLDTLIEYVSLLDLGLLVCALLIHTGLFIFVVSALWLGCINSLWGSPQMHSVRYVLAHLRGGFAIGVLLYGAVQFMLFSTGSLSRRQLSSATKDIIFWSVIALEMLPKLARNTEMLAEDVPVSYTQPAWMKSTEAVWNSRNVVIAHVSLMLLKLTIIVGSLFSVILSIIFNSMWRRGGSGRWYKSRTFWTFLGFVYLLPELPVVDRYHKRDTLPGATPLTPLAMSKINSYFIVWIYFFVAILILDKILAALSRRWPRFARALFIKDPDSDGLSESLDPFGLLAFWFFISNLAACTLWYAFKYNPDDTTNPLWTDVFG